VKGCGHLLGVGYGVLTTHHYKKHYITKRWMGPSAQTGSLEQPKGLIMDISFGNWTLWCPHMSRVDLKGMGSESVDWIHLAGDWGSVVGSSGCGNNPSGTIKGEGYIT
jgi:hypothetical protein